MQTTGLSLTTVAAIENAARVAVYEWSGHTMGIVTVETGTATRTEQAGWIVVEQVDEPAGTSCGRAWIGRPAGHVWLNVAVRCRPASWWPILIGHEIGHAMGFWHVERAGALMHGTNIDPQGQLSAHERTHAAIADRRSAGNRDVDSDPFSSTSGLSVPRMVVD